jgi:hypothetical protein
MADVDRVFQVEFLDKQCEIVGVRVHVIAVPRLTRSAVSASVMGNATVAPRSQEEHLVFKGISIQRPAMGEDDRLTAAPVV